MKTIYSMQLAAGLALAVLATQADAITITPADCGTSGTDYILGSTCWTGTYPKNPNANAVESITGAGSDLTLYYKAQVDEGEEGEEGEFADSYDTVFSPPTDPSGATITYTGSTPINCPECYLIVKDGAGHIPVWYLFDLGDGLLTYPINLSGFWPDGGSISHIGIFGTHGQVPEPAPLALLAFGLVGVGMLRLKKSG